MSFASIFASLSNATTATVTTGAGTLVETLSVAHTGAKILGTYATEVHDQQLRDVARRAADSEFTDELRSTTEMANSLASTQTRLNTDKPFADAFALISQAKASSSNGKSIDWTQLIINPSAPRSKLKAAS